MLPSVMYIHCMDGMCMYVHVQLVGPYGDTPLQHVPPLPAPSHIRFVYINMYLYDVDVTKDFFLLKCTKYRLYAIVDL